MKNKTCTCCKKIKLITQFWVTKENGKQKNYIVSQCKSCLNDKNKKRMKQNRNKINIRRKEYFKEKPWMQKRESIRSRCNDIKRSYTRKGIKNLLLIEEIKYIWFRDKAYLMKKASIDRIDNDGNYEISNCRFIELKENISRCRSPFTAKPKCTLNKSLLIKEYLRNNKSMRKIGDEQKCCVVTVMRHLKKYNIKTRRYTSRKK